ncbi:TPA: hypothetical protein ACK3Q6_004697 [Burkholderia cepacia]|uniref:hypothetical protein n=1 Tax=Burkholderia cepacia TaxID=292 RepID=UPI001CF28DB8|nr:hypothetical protein [Burkholderia cepacia]MCA8357587.1 hypothetical protein [Burkholderia cepacia]HDR9761147.1 hypothetical protein [Burkholderia cepacia ATCC 25416]HDV6368302.1 hypothetical protein [Burkholderia cepacia]
MTSYEAPISLLFIDLPRCRRERSSDIMISKLDQSVGYEAICEERVVAAATATTDDAPV